MDGKLGLGATERLEGEKGEREREREKEENGGGEDGSWPAIRGKEKEEEEGRER
jgi:hypothetical protein